MARRVLGGCRAQRLNNGYSLALHALDVDCLVLHVHKKIVPMPRKGRRDCRKSMTKKNHINGRVEELQKAIRKDRKGASSGEQAAATEAPKLSEKAADFLSLMKAEVQDAVEQTRSTVTSGADARSAGSSIATKGKKAAKVAPS